MISFFCKHFPIFEQMLTKSACLIYKDGNYQCGKELTCVGNKCVNKPSLKGQNCNPLRKDVQCNDETYCNPENQRCETKLYKC